MKFVCIVASKEVIYTPLLVLKAQMDATHTLAERIQLGDIFTNIIAALFKLLFSKPESVAGIIIRGIVFAVASFFIAAVVIASISNNANLSFVLGVLAGAAVFGLYFWYFRKKLDE